MRIEDVFVGTIAAIIGGVGIAAGVANWDAFYELTKLRWLVNRVGRTRARIICIGVGLFFVVVGVAIGFGTRLSPPG